MKKFSIVIGSVFVVLCVSLSVASSALAEDVHTFRVRGVVKALPGRGLAPNEILVKHDPIPEYRDDTGKVVGMMAMTMPFYLNDPAGLQGIVVGDPVELEVEQRIKPTFTDKVIAIKKLPSDK